MLLIQWFSGQYENHSAARSKELYVTERKESVWGSDSKHQRTKWKAALFQALAASSICWRNRTKEASICGWQHQCSDEGQRPSILLWRSLPSTCTTEHLGFVCTKALLKTEGPRASQKGRSASSSPSTQHVKISAFQRSSAKERKRGKR